MSQPKRPIGFQVKICGVKSVDDIRAVEAAAASQKLTAAVGLNFYPPSVRYLDPSESTTRAISEAAAQANLLRVGVFVNLTIDAIESICDSVGLDIVQLHGDEEPKVAAELIANGRDVIRAIKLSAAELTTTMITEKTSPWSAIGCHVLLDADAGAQHGGSGKSLNWETVGQWAHEHPNLSWALAGGINPQNVAESIQQTNAPTVDTASGVEETRGTKSAALIHGFFRSAASAM